MTAAHTLGRTITMNSDGYRVDDPCGGFLALCRDGSIAAELADAPAILAERDRVREALRLCLPYVPKDGDAERDAREAAEDALAEGREA